MFVNPRRQLSGWLLKASCSADTHTRVMYGVTVSVARLNGTVKYCTLELEIQ